MDVLASKIIQRNFQFISCIYLDLNQENVKYLRFEDVYNKDRPITQVYNPQMNRENEVIISQELYDEIKQYENELINEKKYIEWIIKTWVTWKLVLSRKTDRTCELS